jgi:HAD superfamily hydrolase (TIGR01509 family)
MRRKPKAIIFDLYGTLIHIRNDTKAFMRFFNELACEPIHGARRAKRIAFTNSAPTLAELAKLINPHDSLDIKAYEEEISGELERAELYPKARNTLERLRQEGIKRGLISNILSPYISPFFDLGLDQLMDDYIFSCDIGIQKPDPEIYRRMLRKLGLDPDEVWMVGDNPYCDVAVPRSIGMNALLIDRGNTIPAREVISSLDSIFHLLK